MGKKDNSGPLTSLPKKWDDLIKKMPEFKDTADSADVDGLKKIIVECEGNLYTVVKEEDADAKLTAARDMVKDLSEPYRDAKKHQQAKIQYSLLCLESKGVDLDNKGTDES
jgi:hypothetical protein